MLPAFYRHSGMLEIAPVSCRSRYFLNVSVFLLAVLLLAIHSGNGAIAHVLRNRL